MPFASGKSSPSTVSEVKLDYSRLASFTSWQILYHWATWEVWIAMRSSQSILREINPEYSFEGWMNLKLRMNHWWTTQYFGHLIGTANSLEKSLMLGKIEEGIRGWDGWIASLIQWTWTWGNFGRWWRTKRSGVLQSMVLQRIGPNCVTEKQVGLQWYFIPLSFLWFAKRHELIFIN